VLSKGITASLVNTQAIIVACAVIHNICIDMHDDLPNDPFQHEGYDNVDIAEDNHQNENVIGVVRGRQERDILIRDHFANLN